MMQDKQFHLLSKTADIRKVTVVTKNSVHIPARIKIRPRSSWRFPRFTETWKDSHYWRSMCLRNLLEQRPFDLKCLVRRVEMVILRRVYAGGMLATPPKIIIQLLKKSLFCSDCQIWSNAQTYETVGNLAIQSVKVSSVRIETFYGSNSIAHIYTEIMAYIDALGLCEYLESGSKKVTIYGLLSRFIVMQSSLSAVLFYHARLWKAQIYGLVQANISFRLCIGYAGTISGYNGLYGLNLDQWSRSRALLKIPFC